MTPLEVVDWAFASILVAAALLVWLGVAYLVAAAYRDIKECFK